MVNLVQGPSGCDSCLARCLLSLVLLLDRCGARAVVSEIRRRLLQSRESVCSMHDIVDGSRAYQRQGIFKYLSGRNVSIRCYNKLHSLRPSSLFVRHLWYLLVFDCQSKKGRSVYIAQRKEWQLFNSDDTIDHLRLTDLVSAFRTPAFGACTFTHR